MATQANEPNTLEDLLSDNGIAEPMSLKLSLLEIITKHFSGEQIIGSGAYGTVYRGVLGDEFVAVKKLYSSHAIEDKPFQREVDCLMRIRHHNIVWFVGYCAETRVEVVRQGVKNIFAEAREKLLCFEYLRNGSLRNHVNIDEPCVLQWQVCYKIIKGICLGLQYLHESNIIHLDLKPDNILLDDDMVPKIADFGLSRLLDEGKSQTITQEKLGTRGYIAPEYLDKGVITVKADIYSLGVIIRDMLKGRNNQESTTDDVLKSWTIRLEKEPSEMRRTPLERDYRQIEECMEISESCTEFEPEKRPTIADILHRLMKKEAKDQSVVTATPVLGRISSLAKLMKGLRLMASQHPSSSGGDESIKALLPRPPMLASPITSGDQSPDPDKISWLDTRKSAKCYMLSSRSLHIEHADTPGYWKWTNRADSRFAECAELIKVFFLAVIGEILTADLSPGTTYAVYLVYKLAGNAAGLNGTQTSSVRLYGERTVAISSISVNPSAAADMVRPVARHDGWMELKLAEFAPDDKLLLNETAVIVDFREENIRVQKRGLIVEGMEFRSID